MKRTLPGFAALAAALVLAHPAPAQTPSSATHREVAVPGLEKPVDIVVDQWGIAHIFAGGVHDAFFAQGYNAARDRLWQIDLWRKRGLGRLSASFGPAYAAQDRAARLFLYRGDMDQEWASYGPGAKADAQAFVDGVNAYVTAVRGNAAPLPVEFRLTGSAPELWSVDDVVRVRSNGLTRNVDSEVARAQVACAAGLGADRLRRKIEPPHALSLPEGLDPCDVPADVLADYKLATEDVTFQPPPAASAAAEDNQHLADLAAEAAAEGSNNWVVAPSRTSTGRPILANDPHRALGAPSLRYIVGLNAPGLSVIGAGEPALPGVSLGHNDRIAFGLTIFPIDQEDLYVYALNPANPRQYRYDGGWEDMQVVHQTLAVKGEAPRDIELDFTRHGPVLKIDPIAHRAFAIRTIWSDPGTAAYFGSLRYLTAGDWSGFKDAMSHWGAATLNFVYADTGGDIGWIAAGRAPVRPNWDGLMPVPGDGRYEWKGFLSQDELPSSYNPAKGWFATANEMNLPDGYPAEQRKVGFEWSDPTRANRIKSVLAANAHVSLADSMALQTDDYSITDMRAVALLKPLTASDPALARALALLKAWDGRVAAESAAAAIAEVWVNKHLGPAAVQAATPAAARALVGAGSPDAVISYLEAPDAGLGADPKAARDAILLTSLKAAVDELSALEGADMAGWTWGRLHHAAFVPAVAVLADPATRAQMTLGPLELPGSATTPRAATYRMEDFAAIAGASVRMVLDVGAWDNSRVINTPGQSDDPFSAQYRDLFPLWAGGQYVPLLYSRAAVDQAARLVIRLDPAP
ncbi:MAG TPA: penicillin acylase family protein [Caulobacteraceae bacterium]|jgi:penicillin amidase|nr:penicillin acylase family protein [Caulobacteraceae bacterium]